MPDHDAPMREPTHPRTRRRGAREALVVVGVAALLLVLLEGPSIRRSGERMEPGPLRTMVLAVGKPAGWIGDRLPLAEASDDATAFLASGDDDLASGEGGFENADPTHPAASAGGVPPVTPESFDPRELGLEPTAPRALRKLLVTGDSMAQPIDASIARTLADGDAVQVLRDPHIGTGISKTALVDWGRLSARQASRERPDAVVFFLGANEGFPMEVGGGQVECCDQRWAAEYAYRARRMMDTYRRGGEARVYWLTLPLPRDEDRARIARAVNAAIRVAAQPYRAHVRVVDMTELFTPGGRYRESMVVDGTERLVRDADGIHLSEAGADLAARRVLDAVRGDFSLGDGAG